MIAAAKHIQAAPPRYMDSFDSSKWPEEGGNANVHDPDVVDRVYAVAQSEHQLLSGKKDVKARIRELNRLAALSLPGKVSAVKADAVLSLLVFVDGAIQVQEIEESPPCCLSLSATADCAQRSRREPEKLVQLHVCENGSAI